MEAIMQARITRLTSYRNKYAVISDIADIQHFIDLAIYDAYWNLRALNDVSANLQPAF